MWMIYHIINRINQWLDEKLFFEGIDPRILTLKKVVIVAYIAALIPVIFMTALVWHFDMNTLLPYGFYLIAFYTIFIPLLFFLKRKIPITIFIGMTYIIVVTFIYTLKLGGLTNSCGIFFGSLATVIFTAIINDIRFAIWLSIIYVVTIILSGILQPYFQIPADIPPDKNVLFFTLNTTWISIYIIAFILFFILEQTKAEKEETRRLKEQDDAKTQLYTNITHEFRTPLTIILGMVEQIREDPDKWMHNGLKRISHNGKTLLHLVNQMLELAKLKAGANPVNLILSDIILYLKYLTDSFHELAQSKQITLKFSSPHTLYFMDYDPDKILHIVSNLLSNAIKFTPSGGQIEVSAKAAPHGQSSFTICINDNGIGISKDKLSHIFDRFYQVNNNTNHKSAGSGLGLALTKELITLLDGHIEVKSEPGKRTAFTISLPVTQEAPLTEDLSLSQFSELLSTFTSIPVIEKTAPLCHDNTDHAPPIALIVEDNSDVIHYLTTMLDQDYRIMTATNGKEGYKMAIKLIPDIIICDVMMPVMDGFEMLSQLKNDIRTSHIPFILLTAKADVQSRLEGLEKGADAYLTKPFNREELLIRLNKLIELRHTLKERYTTLTPIPPTDNKALQREDSFMEQVRTIMEQHMGDEAFGIDQICSETAMSRAQLYRKFKALSDKTVGEYLRSLRLKKAQELLKKTDLNITQVAFEVGFKNLSHFSHAFLEEFGYNPSKARKD
ncbi:response regulator [Marinilabiliaceae bacterium JC017]|nr:response regulator [Marinilabiliaceae bacterium JC017]